MEITRARASHAHGGKGEGERRAHGKCIQCFAGSEERRYGRVLYHRDGDRVADECK